MKKIEKNYWDEVGGKIRIHHSSESSTEVVDGERQSWRSAPFHVVDSADPDNESLICKCETQAQAEDIISLIGQRDLLKQEIEKYAPRYFRFMNEDDINNILESFE